MYKKNKVEILIIVTMLLGVVFGAKAFFSEGELIQGSIESEKKVVCDDDGMIFEVRTKAKTAGDFLEEQKIEIGEKDHVSVPAESVLYSNSVISISRSKKVTVFDGGSEKEYETFFADMQSFFWDNDIKLAEFDIVDPEISTPICDKMEIEITRVEVREEVKNEPIKFKTITEDDSEMGWRQEKIVQKGENGTKKIIYEVVYHNDKEISRKAKNSEVVSEPTEEIIKKGTYVKIGKAHKGLASWYAQPSHLKTAFPSLTGYYAANPWLPKGSYVKVTNKNSGDSIIARINDRGPFGPGRIIDLDKAAFSAIASLGSGVVDVKMEEILN